MIKSEKDIMKNWKGDISKPLVSICCTTYNQEKYIEDAIKGFLIQETNFPFEIIIRDDASTDKTQEIIKKYQQKYPNIIKTVFEKENTYSKGIQPFWATLKYLNGKYIARCEGDDYWIDSKKLQIQFEVLEKYPECSFSGHDVNIINYNGNIFKHSKGRINQDWGDGIKEKEILLSAIFSIPHTSALFFRKKYINEEYLYKTNTNLGTDYRLFFYLSTKGSLYYLKKTMSVYRKHSGGVSSKWDYTNNNFMNKVIESHDIINKYFNYKYEKFLNIHLKGQFFIRNRQFMTYYINNKKFFKSLKFLLYLIYLQLYIKEYNIRDILWIFKHELKKTFKKANK